MQHDWICMMVFRLSEEQATAMNVGSPGAPTFSPAGVDNPPVLADGRANLRIEDIAHDRTTTGCYRCEKPWSEEIAAEECPGEPIGYTRDGEPRYG